MKTMLVVNSKEEGRRLSDYLCRKADVEIIDIVYNGEEGLQKIIERKPDMVLMNMILPSMDGLEIMEALSENLLIPELPHVIIVSAVDNPLMMECVCQAGADYYIQKPYRMETIYCRMQQLMQGKQRSRIMEPMSQKDDSLGNPEVTDPVQKNIDAMEKQLELEITEVLRRIGMPAHIKGYQYIREGIMIAVQDISVLNYITKLLYPSIAKQYNTTPSSVERAIRHAIEVAWNRGDMAALQEVFGFTISKERGKPTNSEFIAQIADQYRVDYNIRKRA